MTSTDAELRPRRMSGLCSIQMVRSAKLLSIWTRADSLATADFRYKSAIFCARGVPADATSAEPERGAPEMAEFISNSAIPSEGSIRTSWPALRNGDYANQNGYQ